MTERICVLVTAAGGVIGEGIVKSLKLANSKGGPASYKILATDASPRAAGLYRSDAGFLVPLVSHPDYVDSLVRLCKDQGVLAIFVGSDEELLTSASAADRIARESGAKVITNPIEVISIGSDKWKTYEFMRRQNLPCAESALPEGREGFIKEFGFPLVVKPRDGHGSEQFYIANDSEEVEHAVTAIRGRGWHPLLQEYLEGDDSEFTTGVTVDNDGKGVMSSISMRRTLKGGQTYKAFIDDFQEERTSAEKVALALGARGPINVQARLVRDEVKTFEINPRISASCPLRAVAGVNEPDIIVRNQLLGERIRIERYDRLVCFRYWNEVYLPYESYEAAGRTGVVGPDASWIPEYF